MAFNKAKALQEAERFAVQGKISQAIRYYFGILERDPSDLSVLNTIGDLYIRERNVPEGLKQFYRLAEAYVQEEFTVKAIAIYRKIAKLDPNSVDALLKLAELYQTQRLAREARELYFQVAEYYKKNNQNDKALETLRKAVQLDVENATARTRLAVLCEQTGRKDEAGQLYLETAQMALQRGDAAAAQIALNRAQELDPDNSQAFLLRAREALASNPQGVEAILTALPGLKDSPAGKSLQFESYLSTRQLEKAEKVMVDLFHRNPADFSPVTSFVSACVQVREFDIAFKALSALAGEIIQQRETSSLVELLRLIWNESPQHFPTLELINRIREEGGNESALSEILQALGRAYMQCGQLEKAEQAFQTLARREPGTEQYRDLLNQVRELQGKEVDSPQPADLRASATSPVTEEESVATVAPAAQNAEREAMVGEALENSDLFARYHLMAKAVAELDKVLEIYPDEIEIHERLVEVCRNSMPQRAQQAAQALERIYEQRGVSATAKRYAQLAAGQEAPVEEAPTLPALPAAATPTSLPPAVAGLASAAPHEAEVGPEFSLAAGEESGTTPTPPVASTDFAEFTLDLLPPPEQEAPAPLAAEIPLNVSVPPATEFPATSDGKTTDIPTACGPEVPPTPSWESHEIDLSEDWESVQAPNTSPSLVPEPSTEITSLNFEESRIEVNFYLENGLVEEARESVAELARKLSGDPRIADLQALVEAHTGSSIPDVHKEPTPESAAISAASVAGPASPLGGLLEEMGEAPDDTGRIQEDDPQTHYSLGVAFREMSLLDEAIGEFQKVVRGAGKGQFPPNYLQACSLLAICFMEKGMAAVATRWYRRALETPDLDEEAKLALQYDLGIAYEQAGDVHTAVEKFTEVYGQNIDFRDVADKIRILRPKVS